MPVFWREGSAALIRLFKISLQAREDLALYSGAIVPGLTSVVWIFREGKKLLLLLKISVEL